MGPRLSAPKYWRGGVVGVWREEVFLEELVYNFF
jgi:hypothetical protein